LSSQFSKIREIATPRRLAMLPLAFALAGALLSTAGAQTRVAGFYVGYDSGNYPPSAIDFTSVSQVNVFSVLPKNDGTIDTTLFIDSVNGPLVAQNVASLAHAAGRKAVLVVGGAGSGTQFHSATSSTYMNAFVQNLINTITAWGFDGIDIDWEPLPSSDYPAMLSLVSKLRTGKPGMIITADVGWLNSNFALSSTDMQFYVNLGAAVDQMNIMTYGMADNWGGWVSWHSSAIYGQGGSNPSSVSNSVSQYVSAGVPAAKLSLGIGFYGSCWNAPVTGPLQPPGTSHVVASDNTMGFANIKKSYYNAANYHVDQSAQAPYLSFGSPTGPAGCTFISYEDEASVAQKGQYAAANGLGGAIVWQLNEGYNPGAADPNSLLHAVGNAFLGGTASQSTATSLSASANPAVVGQTVTLTATVSSGDGSSPSGSVSFKDGTTLLGSASLNGGQAVFGIATLAVGSHSLTAMYGGSTGYLSSTSPAVAETINKADTTTVLTSSVNPAVSGQATTLTVTLAAVSPGSGTPTGTVTFKDGSTSLGTATLSAGKAVFTTSTLAVGSHSLTAVYAGATAYTASASAVVTETVTKASTATTVVSSADPVRAGHKVTFTATVAAVAPGTGTPSGTVLFYDGSVQIGSASLSGGRASLTITSLTAGVHSISASYAGSANYAGSVSVAVSETVK